MLATLRSRGAGKTQATAQRRFEHSGNTPPRRLKPAPLKPARRTAVVMKPAQPERATSAPEEDDLQAIIETYRFALNMMDD
jgi:hypothetical protein